MAIDTESLTKVNSDFRKLKAKDSITPESLGSIIQRIADLFANAGTSNSGANGYVPYIFRLVRKRNLFDDKDGGSPIFRFSFFLP